ncbi:assimilatory nitrate reductase (NADH) alpha subunit apoprotein [Sanguibacter gelidistatuariae]|uniref:Assimilatory nitrate reductase (NADH) alpha subunit apoprotein n=1 Tax=Sanguibacter gelidistatuariae TaxID=1814289 RepID=A0A1G6H9U7_9MICO|nr:molybdopterin oxidoreductase family protein [Sanguibacter gelidistatuariae]SDB91067.1 assimilatory nitrate reductase (NADH) alpha subunit apoprotein [Sanguibacter gelidistatuariae]
MTSTHCPYCALQCAMSLGPVPDAVPAPASHLAVGGGPGMPDGAGETAAAAMAANSAAAAEDRPRGVLAEATIPGGPARVVVHGRDFPTNKGGLCQKGWTSASVLGAGDRLTTPLVRGADGELRAASWDDALDLIAERATTIAAEHGQDAVAVFGGGGLTNEKAYALGKFARTVLRTANIDYNGRFCMASAAAGANRAFGLDRGLPFPLADLGGAQAVILLGSNLAETMPPALQHLAGARERGGLIVVDPRRSATATLTADGAGVHLQPVPGTDLVVLLALLHVVWAEGLSDAGYLESRTTGADAVRRSVAAWWPERAEQVCGIDAGELRRVARLLAAASPAGGGSGAYILTGRGVEQSTQGTATVTAAINLALALGLPGRVGSGYGAVTGQGNGQGGREHGQKADQLPGYRKIDDPAAREHVARVWGVDPASIPGPGLPAVELLRRLAAPAGAGTPAGPRMLFVHGSNLVVSAPNSTRVTANLQALDFLVVCDFVPSETALLADVILPVTQWAEEEGTMTSLEGRVIRRRKALAAPPGVRSELDIFADLAARLGSPVHFGTDPAKVFDELARASAGGPADYSGLSHARLDAESEPGLFWPCPAPPAQPARPDQALAQDRPAISGQADQAALHPGTPRTFLDSFPTPDGRARMIAVDHVGPSDDLRPDAPLYLITGRVLQHYQSGAQTRRVSELAAAQPGPFVEIHPVLALTLGIDEGAPVRLATARGAIVAGARLTTAVRPDTVFMPFHWSGPGSVNRITTDATDPISGMPEFKLCAVDVSLAGAVVPARDADRISAPAPSTRSDTLEVPR